MRVTHLRCEYFENPLAIDAARPRLSWRIEDERRGVMQSAYRVLVAGSRAKLDADEGDLWDSGRIGSDESVHVVYGGKALASRDRCWWKVQVWDERGEQSAWSEPAVWEMGLLEKGEWVGKWIASPIVGGPYSIPPVPHLRREFEVAKRVESARLYVTALGLHECYLNGRRVSEDVFVPGRTEYTKRVPYHVYDVTALVKEGKNAIGAMLGDGWYCGHLHSDPRQTYGDRPRVLAQLELVFSDGSKQTIATDETWKTKDGPVRSSDMLMGEDYDARLELPGWAEAGYDDSGWSPAVLMADPGIAVVGHRAPPPRRRREVRPVGAPTVSANKRRHIFDMGQNMVGWVRLRVRNAKPGQTIDLRYTEMLDKDGKPYTLSLRTARATDHYTTKGGGEEWFEPRFTFHGFRYVEVRDYPGGNPTVDDLVGVVVYSDCEEVGTFECSDPLINKLQSNIVWSQRGNFLDIPTDCPQRDERLGWTGDAQVFLKTATFNMDVAAFFTKWLQDMQDSQGDDGRIPSVVPSVKTIYGEGGPAWADAAVICPWTLYLCYRDKRILEDCWPMMSRFIEFLAHTCPQHVRPADGAKWKGYGDWLSMGAETPANLIGTAFYAYCADLMARIAGVLGKPEAVAKYRGLFGEVREVFRQRFVGADGKVTPGTQTAYVLALHFDLLPEEMRDGAARALVEDIRARGDHLSTGFVGTPYLNEVLTRFGHADVAYALLEQKTYPGWLYPVTQGATTMWERWNAWTHEQGFGDASMNSYNHYAFGAIGAWMYATVAGIEVDPSAPGYKRIVLRPTPGGSLTHAAAVLDSPHGRIESRWRVEGGVLHYEAVVPPNTTAVVRLTGVKKESVREAGKPVIAQGVTNTRIELGSGRYVFTAELVGSR